MELGLVSVIMPTYNTGSILIDSIESILNQTYKNLELIITDDKSDDGTTRGILASYAEKDKRVRVFFLESNMGPGVARNNSIKNARGQYIAFCDSDDCWFPDKLERQVNFILEKKCCLTYSAYVLCDQHNKEKGIVVPPAKVTYGMMKRDNKIGCLTVLYDTAAYGKFYFPLLRKRQDWAMILTIMQKCGTAYGLQEPLASYRLRSGSLSHNKLSLVKYNINVYNKVLGFSQAKSCLYFFLVFLPCYFMKVTRVRAMSHRYLKSRQTS